MEASESVYDFLAWLSGIILVLGVVLNGVVCITFLTYRSLLSGENVLIFSIAISDLLSCAIAVPTSMISNIERKWVFGNSGCVIHAFATTWFGVVSITHLAALAYHRYETMAVLQEKLLSDGRVAYSVPALWVYSFVFAIAPVAGWSRFIIEGIGTSCSVDWRSSDANSVSYTAFIFTGCFVVPVGVIFFSYSKVYKAVRQMTAAANNTWGNMSEAARASERKELKMAALLLAMIIAFLVSWTPFATVSLVSAFGGSHHISPVAASVPSFLAKTSNLYNPVLYFLMYKRFREKMFKLLRECRRMCCQVFTSNMIYPEQSASK